MPDYINLFFNLHTKKYAAFNMWVYNHTILSFLKSFILHNNMEVKFYCEYRYY